MDETMIELTIAALREVALDTREIVLARRDGGELPQFSAGSHVVCALPVHGGIKLNPYSLLGDPARRDRWRIAVQRDAASRGGSAWLCEQARVGATLRVSAPVNRRPIAREASHHLLIGAGIGITPMLAYAHELARDERTFEVHYAYRERARAAFVDELEEVSPGRLHRYDDSLRQRLQLGALLAGRAPTTHVYISGPRAMIEQCRATTAAMGWHADRLHA
ncbi:MAG: ferredoxin reductase [Burkholderiales bacterium]|nr:ferredoxin reductase [Burkholderiales bacterium]MDE1925845.1 ferredoxin reductase [Burkholderiales bacterium]MDE2160443.1 ferredoxin reductase [Burkholderiales bacterium]MDE2503056.1 ferredoxin reductase [Burkholderiales bacterium]